MNNYEKSVVEQERNYTVVKSNILVLNSRYQYSVNQQKTLAYICSKIKPITEYSQEPKYQLEYKFEVSEYLQLLGVESSGNQYALVKETLQSLSDKSMWIPIEDENGKGEVLVRWLSNVAIYPKSGKIKIKIDKERYFYIQKGDKVMNVKNNYKTLSVDGVISPIFNGWMGIVEDIDENKVYVNFPLAHDITIIEKKDARNQLTLGYASTVHKIQGDSAPIIIGAIDYSTPPSLLTHQLIYTLLTRAKNYCVLVAQNGALRKAIATDFVSSKRTFLPEFLDKIMG